MKKVVLWISSTLLVLAVLTAALPTFFSSSLGKPIITYTLESFTGYHYHIGSLSIGWWSPIKVEKLEVQIPADDITIWVDELSSPQGILAWLKRDDALALNSIGKARQKNLNGTFSCQLSLTPGTFSPESLPELLEPFFRHGFWNVNLVLGNIPTHAVEEILSAQVSSDLFLTEAIGDTLSLTFVQNALPEKVDINLEVFSERLYVNGAATINDQELKISEPFELNWTVIPSWVKAVTQSSDALNRWTLQEDGTFHILIQEFAWPLKETRQDILEELLAKGSFYSSPLKLESPHKKVLLLEPLNGQIQLLPDMKVTSITANWPLIWEGAKASLNATGEFKSALWNEFCFENCLRQNWNFNLTSLPLSLLGEVRGSDLNAALFGKNLIAHLNVREVQDASVASLSFNTETLDLKPLHFQIADETTLKTVGELTWSPDPTLVSAPVILEITQCSFGNSVQTFNEWFDSLVMSGEFRPASFRIPAENPLATVNGGGLIKKQRRGHLSVFLNGTLSLDASFLKTQSIEQGEWTTQLSCFLDSKDTILVNFSGFNLLFPQKKWSFHLNALDQPKTVDELLTHVFEGRLNVGSYGNLASVSMQFMPDLLVHAKSPYFTFQFSSTKTQSVVSFETYGLPATQLAQSLEFHSVWREKIEALFGDKLNIHLNARLHQEKGVVTGDFTGENSRGSLNGQIESGVFYLKDPLKIEVDVTPAISKSLIESLVPFLSTAKSGSQPIRITIMPKGFRWPLFSGDLTEAKIEQGIIELGYIEFKPGGELGTVLGVLGQKYEKDPSLLSMWFTPLYFHLNNGAFELERVDILIGRRLPAALWGKVDFLNDRVNLKVGLGAKTLEQAFGVKGLPAKFMVPLDLKGNLEHAGIDKTKATAKITSLFAQGQGSPEGLLLGGVLDLLSGNWKEEPVPEPTTNPFPWENGSQEEPRAPEKQNPFIKSIEKGASSLIKKLIR